MREWLAREPLNPVALSGLEPEEVCRQLPGLIENPAPPAGTTVNFANRVERGPVAAEAETDAPAAAPADTRRYTYPVTFPRERLGVLEVTLQRSEGRWQAVRVGPQQTLQSPTIPAVLQTPAAAWIFGVLSLGFLYLLVRPSFFRRWLAEGWGYVREHRRLTIVTTVVLYGLFGLGVLTGANLPPECAQVITDFVEQGVSQLGAAQAYESGNVARAAVVTLYQNFVMGAVVTTYAVAFISFGLLAYLLNGARFFGARTAVRLPYASRPGHAHRGADPYRGRADGLCAGHSRRWDAAGDAHSAGFRRVQAGVSQTHHDVAAGLFAARHRGVVRGGSDYLAAPVCWWLGL